MAGGGGGGSRDGIGVGIGIGDGIGDGNGIGIGVSAVVGDPALLDFVSQIVEGSTPAPSHSARL
jgi:hypothetical protein